MIPREGIEFGCSDFWNSVSTVGFCGPEEMMSVRHTFYVNLTYLYISHQSFRMFLLLLSYQPLAC